MMTKINYEETVKELALDIMYTIADLTEKEFMESSIHNDIEGAVDIISVMFKMPRSQVDINVSEEMSKLDMKEMIKLKQERQNSTIQ